MADRTQQELFADRLDLDLSNLARRAAAHAQDRNHWQKVAQAIEAARGLVRQKMHAHDRELTKG